MTGFVTTAGGESYRLPAPVAWQMQYTAGVPCDSFMMRCPCDEGGHPDSANWRTFYAMEDGEVVFRGVVDECECSLSGKGALLEVSGRGMAALLLDNEALGQDYATATLDDILRNHVAPYGVQTRCELSLPPVSRFSVATGSSEWSVVYDFCRYYGGVTPRFDREGRLVIAAQPERSAILIGDGVPVTQLVRRDRRYGVLSEILIRDRVRQCVERIENEAFLESGGRCRRVLTMPGRSDYQSMRYSGEFQLDKSRSEQLRVEIEVAQGFYAQPGDLVELRRSGWAGNGLYRVVQAQVSADASGCRTRLELAERDIML